MIWTTLFYKTKSALFKIETQENQQF